MTCIAYKAPFIVGDQRVNGVNNVLFGNTKKIHHCNLKIEHDLFPEDHGQLYVGLAGDCGTEKVLLKLIVASLIGKDEDQDYLQEKVRKYLGDKKESGFESMFVHMKDGKPHMFTLEPNLLLLEYSSPFTAIGSGADVALGAMAHGANAWQAVHHATVWNGSCGYPLNGYNVFTGEHFTFNDFDSLKEFLNGH